MAMAPPSNLLLRLRLIFLTLTLSLASVYRVASSLTEDAAFVSDSPLLIELDQLRFRISILETKISEREEELKSKDDNIKEMKKKIEDKSDYIASLNIQIQPLLKQSHETEKLKSKTYARFDKLTNQAGNLRKEIDAQIKKKDDLEVCIYTAEKHIRELNLKLNSLQKISDQQRTMISKIKHDIQLAEEKLMKLKIEASLQYNEMNQTYIIALWAEHGRPLLYGAIQRALGVKTIVQERAGLHIKAIKKNWIPKMKQQWSMFVLYVEPRIVEFQESTIPYIQEAKKFLKPYLTQLSVISKPHFDRLKHGLKLYTREIVQTYERLICSVMAQHTQVQNMICELFKSQKYTKPLIQKDIMWYLASAIFALPAILIVNLYTSVACKKPQKHRHKDRTHPRAKRLRPEN